MSGPRTRSKKIEKVVSTVDNVYLGSIEEMRLLGEPSPSNKDDLILYDYQYRLDVSVEFPAVAVSPVKPWSIGSDAPLPYTANDTANLSSHWGALRLRDVPEALYAAGEVLYRYAAQNGIAPRNLTLTITRLICSKAELQRLEELYGEAQKLPVTYDASTQQVIDYNPQPAKEEK